MLPLCDNLLLTGGIANTFLKALNINVGFSLVCNDKTLIDDIKKMLLQYKDKIVLPFDAIVGSSYDKTYTDHKMINKIDDNDIILDLGPKTIQKYGSIINKSNTVFVNGTAGKYEEEKYAVGTKELLNVLEDSGADVIVGGGDAVSAVNKFLPNNSFKYLCTGGGATLEYIVNGTLPGLDILDVKDNEEEEYEILDI